MIDKDLLFGRPIKLTHGLGMIYQPILKDFITNYSYAEFTRSFNIKKEYIFDDPPENIKNFDIFFLFLAISNENKNLSSFIRELINSLALLYKCPIDDIKIKEDNTKESMEKFYIEIRNEYILNRNNYDYLCVTVMNMLDNEIQTQENGEMSEIEKKIAKARIKYEKEHKKNEVKKDTYDIFDLANYIIHTDGSIYNYETIQNLTIYQIKNTCKLYQQKEGYNTFMQYKTSGQFDIKDEVKHWFFNKEDK